MYVCGPTVYGRAHIGNARPAVVFDTLARLIRHQFGADSLVYARNVTDVDDKIIAAATKENVGYRVITERYYRHYIDDMAALNVLPPTFEPRATAYVPRMINFIERLIRGRHAYVAEGHVLFDVSSDPSYGSLSRRDRNSIVAGARVEVAPYKKNPEDFVLWKPAGTTAEQVALSFDSPWGPGRPGWHIECSAMIEAFGSRKDAGGVETIDIHGGGLDLIFPHHENEIAQSRCAHDGAPLAHYWLHNGFVDMGVEKMSKSLGNIITPAELLAQGHRGETLRLALLSAHYRSPLPWTEDLVQQSRARLDRWYFAKMFARRIYSVKPPSEFVAALADDLNTPLALKILDELATQVLNLRTQIDHHAADQDFRSLHDVRRRMELRARQLTSAGRLLGLLCIPAAYWLSGKRLPRKTHRRRFELSSKDIKSLISQREHAKRARDFDTADQIRSRLKSRGIQLIDLSDGTTEWQRM
jgi:cysteinyl-tRNA synthetase